MLSCHTSLGPLSSRVLILGSRFLLCLRLPICFLELLVIRCGLFSHLHTIRLERCVFLYAFMSGASISFPHLFLHSLNEVHRSSSERHALIHSIFIHKIVLFFNLADFPSSEPVYVVAPLDATFLR